jgi:hypothetical protein
MVPPPTPWLLGIFPSSTLKDDLPPPPNPQNDFIMPPKSGLRNWLENLSFNYCKSKEQHINTKKTPNS